MLAAPPAAALEHGPGAERARRPGRRPGPAGRAAAGGRSPASAGTWPGPAARSRSTSRRHGHRVGIDDPRPVVGERPIARSGRRHRRSVGRRDVSLARHPAPCGTPGADAALDLRAPTLPRAAAAPRRRALPLVQVRTRAKSWSAGAAAAGSTPTRSGRPACARGVVPRRAARTGTRRGTCRPGSPRGSRRRCRTRAHVCTRGTGRPRSTVRTRRRGRRSCSPCASQ